MQVTGNATIEQDMQVNGNATIGTDMQVNGNETVMQNFNVMGNETIAGSLQVNGSQTVSGNIGAGSTVSALFRMVTQSQSTVPAGGFTSQQVRFYPAILPGQPGLVLKGTDGNNYVMFVDVSSGTPTLALMRALAARLLLPAQHPADVELGQGYTEQNEAGACISLDGHRFVHEQQSDDGGHDRLQGKNEACLGCGRILLSHGLQDKAKRAAHEAERQHRHPAGDAAGQARGLQQLREDEPERPGKAELPNADAERIRRCFGCTARQHHVDGEQQGPKDAPQVSEADAGLGPQREQTDPGHRQQDAKDEPLAWHAFAEYGRENRHENDRQAHQKARIGCGRSLKPKHDGGKHAEQDEA
ncbi:hypothetical protein BGX30_004270 [Mortierella sp. GBA39]|nr:hypothetical protein BGX30_004270 [Mortierella sp. GBA39]